MDEIQSGWASKMRCHVMQVTSDVLYVAQQEAWTSFPALLSNGIYMDMHHGARIDSRVLHLVSRAKDKVAGGKSEGGAVYVVRSP